MVTQAGTGGSANAFDEISEPVFVARQPVFDKKLSVWGYELLFRNSRDVNRAEIADSGTATASVIIDGIAQAREGLSQDKALLINFPRALLLDDTPLLLPETCIIEILEDVGPDPELLEKLEAIKEERMLAVDDFTGLTGHEPGYDRILEISDIIKVDVLGMAEDRVRELAGNLRPFGKSLLAEKVETREVFHQASRLGFSLFQGFFFSRPEIVKGRKLSSSQISRLRLMQELEQREFDPNALAAVIESDVSLSYRLLRYINSPGIGLLAKVRSIRHAVSLLGEKRIRQWLRILIMVDLNSTDRGIEVLRMSSMRGYMLQLLAESYPSPMDPHSMFLTGLFSGLDAILNQPMARIMHDLPLDDLIKKTLMGEAHEPARYLMLAKALEKGDWEGLYRLSTDLGLQTDILAGLHMRTMRWGDALLAASLSTEGDE